MFLGLCKWVPMPSEARGIGAPRLELHMVVSCPTWMLGTKLKAFWKSRMHSTMEPSFPSWFCTIFPVCSMYSMCGGCECMYPCTQARVGLQELSFSLSWKLTTMARLGGWLGNSRQLQTCLPLYVAGDLYWGPVRRASALTHGAPL